MIKNFNREPLSDRNAFSLALPEPQTYIDRSEIRNEVEKIIYKYHPINHHIYIEK